MLSPSTPQHDALQRGDLSRCICWLKSERQQEQPCLFMALTARSSETAMALLLLDFATATALRMQKKKYWKKATTTTTEYNYNV
ncbi:hypothetical protein ACLKA7_013190 [Drosophila subpalustris]